jgi:hypothetical protein
MPGRRRHTPWLRSDDSPTSPDHGAPKHGRGAPALPEEAVNLNREDRRRLPKVLGPDDAAHVVRILVCPEHHEGQLVLALDSSGQVCGAEFRCPCDACRDELLVDGTQLAALTAALGGIELVLVTFVDDEQLAPAPADVARFEGLRVECAGESVELLDHLLFSGHRWRSICEVSVARGA